MLVLVFANVSGHVLASDDSPVGPSSATERKDLSGLYILRNSALPPGYLSYTNKGSGSGYYAQCLSSSNGNYNREREYYNEGGRWRASVLWEISLDKTGFYTIRNSGLSPGYLSYTNEGSGSGHYVQCLSSSNGNYNREREYYNEGGRWRASILWELIKKAS